METRCADCSSLQEVANPNMIIKEWISARRPTREDPLAKELSCFKQVATFKDKTHWDDRECGGFLRWIPGMQPEATIVQEDFRRERAKDGRKVNVSLILAAIAAVAAVIGAYGTIAKFLD